MPTYNMNTENSSFIMPQPAENQHMELASKFDAKKIEDNIRQYIESVNVEKQILDSDKPEKIMFIEGPPTMNGMPHVGHLRGRVIKDLWYRFNTLQGKKITFNGGWDTQGLPIELQAEKELGVTGGKSEVMQKIGIERLVRECKDIVKKFNSKWVETDRLLGMSFNHDKAYWTYHDKFIEREWQILQKAHENGILEEDFTVIAYCPSCQTSLSHAEVNQGYEEVKDPSLYYKVKLRDEDAFLIVWTTMPFTLVTDAMVGLHPTEEYAYVKVGGQTWVVGDTRLEQFMAEIKIDDYTVEKKVRGAEFEGKKYIHPLLDRIPGLEEYSRQSNFHMAVSEEFVDATAGSGIVHLSPANGEEDIGIANKRKVTVFNPIDDEVKFTAQAGKYAGMFVRDADMPIVEDLRERDALVRIGKIRHKYPLCWRSRHPIVWLARKGWFYKLDRLEDKAIDAADSVEYFFDQPKNRFLGIIKEKHPWCISRERFWGCPLPVWICQECLKQNWFFTREDIIKSAAHLPDGSDFELHRPWIDRITIRCMHCNSQNTKREKYVLDTWHNSGSAPYASLSDKEYSESIPALFLTEGIDQTRGWAYTLLIENVIFNNSPVPPYRSFLFQGHVLDAKGGKMSKSVGNVIDGLELLAKYPVDLIRFYFIWKASPIEPLSFSTDEMMSRPYQVVNTLYNLHLYFMQNSRYDNFDDKVNTMSWVKENRLLMPPDIWLLSKLQRLISVVTGKNQSCRFHEGARAIDDYIINILSQVYIPITRTELWNDDESKISRRIAIYAVLSEVLRTLDILIHPLCPFTSEYLYQTTFPNKKIILLEKWPESYEDLIDDDIEKSFDIMKDVISMASAARMKGRVKRRWPLSEALICLKPGKKQKLEPLADMLKAQLNVERVTIVEMQDMEDVAGLEEMRLPVRPTVELVMKRVGPKAKQHIRRLVEMFSETRPEEIVLSLRETSQYGFEVDQKEIMLDADDFVTDFDAAQGYAMVRRDDSIVFVSTDRDDEMLAQGLVKDMARRLQALRKEKGYNPTDMLNVASILDLDEESHAMLKAKSQDLAFLVRVKEISFTESCDRYSQADIDGQKIRIAVE